MLKAWMHCLTKGYYDSMFYFVSLYKIILRFHDLIDNSVRTIPPNRCDFIKQCFLENDKSNWGNEITSLICPINQTVSMVNF